MPTPESIQLERIRLLCTETEGGRGIWKRIDENRGFLSFLQETAPELLERAPFLEIWLGNNDIFFVNLLHLLELEKYPPWMGGDTSFPRKWPGIPEIEKAYLDFANADIMKGKNMHESNHCDQIFQEFYGSLPEVTEQIKEIFSKFGLNQKQAACAAACALNQMSHVDGNFPQHVTISLSPALNLQGN